MKKFLLAAALCASLTASADIEVGFIDTDALNLYNNTLTSGTILRQSKSVVLTVENDEIFEQYSLYTVNESEKFPVAIINGEAIALPKWGIRGSQNPPAQDIYKQPQKGGCQYHFSVTKDGWIIIPSRFNAYKSYYVYEGIFDTSMTPMAYSFGMFINDPNYSELHSGAFTLPSEPDGYLDLNSPEIDKYLYDTSSSTTIKMPIKIFTLDDDAISASMGIGAIAFPVKAEKNYVVFATGSKMVTCGYIFVDNSTTGLVPDVSITGYCNPNDVLTIMGLPQVLNQCYNINSNSAPVIIGKNSTCDYEVALNIDPACGFQFDMTFPAGLSLVDMVYGGEVNDNLKLNFSRLSNGDYRIIGYSADGSIIPEAMLSMQLSSDVNLTRGKIVCHDAMLSIDDNELVLNDQEILVTGYEVSVDLPEYLGEGETFTLPNPVEAAGDDVTYQWGTNNSYVATVENNDLLEALNPGNVEITLALNDPEFTKTYSYALEVISALWGDVDGDGAINIADMVAMVNYILGRETENFDEHLADIDRNGRINIVDLTSLIKLILSQPQEESPQGMRAFAPTDNSEISFGEAVTLGDNFIQIPIEIDAVRSYSALQAEIVIPEGMTIESITLADGLRDHAIDYASIGGNASRIVIYSASLGEIPANQTTALATVTLRGNAVTGDMVYLTNAIACTTDCTAYTPGNAAVELSEHSGIENVSFDNAATSDAPVYNMQGIKVDATSLPAGVYIRDGRKFIVK